MRRLGDRRTRFSVEKKEDAGLAGIWGGEGTSPASVPLNYVIRNSSGIPATSRGEILDEFPRNSRSIPGCVALFDTPIRYGKIRALAVRQDWLRVGCLAQLGERRPYKP